MAKEVLFLVEDADESGIQASRGRRWWKRCSASSGLPETMRQFHQSGDQSGPQGPSGALSTSRATA